MFYSHEILSNSQYGVATIWLAATIGKNASAGKGVLRRLTKKAVQGVDVPKACEIIINPGAPLALRLQGSLLYGVSRVFAEQCRYMLSDAEKTQSDMMTFFRVLQTNETDPRAGKTKRHLIMLEDDPGFDIFGALPSLDLLGWDTELAGVPSQGSTNRFSFMTPQGALSQASHSSSQNQPFLSSGPRPSSLGASDYRLPSEFGHHSSPLPKHNRDLEAMPEFQPFVEDELDQINAIGLDFDADGNLIDIIEAEPELPLLSGTGPQAQPESRDSDRVGGPEGQLILEEGDRQVLSLGEAALPDAEAFPVQRAARKAPKVLAESSETTETEQASAHIRRGRPRKLNFMVDKIDRVSRQEFRSWTENYVQHMDGSRKRRRITTQAQAKKNAVALLYGNRIAGIGILHGDLAPSHPLAQEFAGRALKARLEGLRTDEVEYGYQEKRGRRRKSPEAFGQDDAARGEQRNVRQRIDEDAELGRGDSHDGDGLVFGDDSAPEIGMEAAPPMEDRRSSSMMPWSRPASVTRGQGSAQKGVPSPSPLHTRGGSVVGSIEHHSDPIETPLGAAMGLGARDDSSLDFGSSLGALDFNRGDQEIPGGVVARDAHRGTEHRWITFDELADPETHTKAVAAQAFLHVLSLASKSAIAVEQDGAAHNVPFGTIRVGIPVPAHRSVASEEDELA
ncbi:Rad21/Rec8 like protein [Hirsutella rhossiliensis]|uniref:Rad21/Rec8 like protein n=1 Tax=Hirsutella rhossiliensis TaxID=111463 RepID=A0A9P8N3A3_9HYPO|nr:Rad21/Rec8 like protein [Hirsutella rhossiliensis]KAH0963927.1 Rad21/Rec8 like protein [Hirsutella rhossiliensis]